VQRLAARRAASMVAEAAGLMAPAPQCSSLLRPAHRLLEQCRRQERLRCRMGVLLVGRCLPAAGSAPLLGARAGVLGAPARRGSCSKRQLGRLMCLECSLRHAVKQHWMELEQVLRSSAWCHKVYVVLLRRVLVVGWSCLNTKLQLAMLQETHLHHPRRAEPTCRATDNTLKVKYPYRPPHSHRYMCSATKQHPTQAASRPQPLSPKPNNAGGVPGAPTPAQCHSMRRDEGPTLLRL
jgi:hypothetical protein